MLGIGKIRQISSEGFLVYGAEPWQCKPVSASITSAMSGMFIGYNGGRKE